MTDSQLAPEHQLQNPELLDFANFTKLPVKFELLDKRGFELMAKRRADSCPLGQLLFIN